MMTETGLHDYCEEDLARLDEAGLLALLINGRDTVPRVLIDACAARGDTMISALQQRFDDPGFWRSGEDGLWWLRLHMATIAGLIPSERAAQLLISLMRRLDEVDDHDMQDWLAGYWSALFADKPPIVVTALRELTADRHCDAYIRSNAAQAALFLAQQAGETERELALDWLAAMVEDEGEDEQLRLNLSMDLLDFPRERYRPLLETMAKGLAGDENAYDQESIETAYCEGIDRPEWERFADPWKFYTPEAIAQRRQRWAEEAGEESDFLAPWQEPYTREEGKVGRNDPCPCGSGKKYKKCCLH
jgi:uncharacterized protein YecA (UPF0149 family)